MRTKESWLHTEIQETLRVLKRLEDKMRIVARTYEVDKLRLHIQEIEKIISLIVSLTYRLIPVDTSLANMEWNGVEERFSELFDTNLTVLITDILDMTLSGDGQNYLSSWRRLACSGGISSGGQAWWLGTFSRTFHSR